MHFHQLGEGAFFYAFVFYNINCKLLKIPDLNRGFRVTGFKKGLFSSNLFCLRSNITPFWEHTVFSASRSCG